MDLNPSPLVLDSSLSRPNFSKRESKSESESGLDPSLEVIICINLNHTQKGQRLLDPMLVRSSLLSTFASTRQELPDLKR